MSTPKKSPVGKPTLEKVLERFLERDEEHHSAWLAITSKQNDHSRMLEAVQVEVQRIGRTMEMQAGINERQIKLAEATENHSKTFDRAFNEIQAHREDFNEWREKDYGPIKNQVTQGRGALWMLLLVGGALWALIVALGTMSTSNIRDSVDKLEAKHDRDKLSHDTELKALARDVQEVRLARQRDREARDRAAARDDEDDRPRR
jgi:hypothetical protein